MSTVSAEILVALEVYNVFVPQKILSGDLDDGFMSSRGPEWQLVP